MDYLITCLIFVIELNETDKLYAQLILRNKVYFINVNYNGRSVNHSVIDDNTNIKY